MHLDANISLTFCDSQLKLHALTSVFAFVFMRYSHWLVLLFVCLVCCLDLGHVCLITHCAPVRQFVISIIVDRFSFLGHTQHMYTCLCVSAVCACVCALILLWPHWGEMRLDKHSASSSLININILCNESHKQIHKYTQTVTRTHSLSHAHTHIGSCR